MCLSIVLQLNSGRLKPVDLFTAYWRLWRGLKLPSPTSLDPKWQICMDELYSHPSHMPPPHPTNQPTSGTQKSTHKSALISRCNVTHVKPRKEQLTFTQLPIQTPLAHAPLADHHADWSSNRVPSFKGRYALRLHFRWFWF